LGFLGPELVRRENPHYDYWIILDFGANTPRKSDQGKTVAIPR
jgi:hypothetical protein